MIDIDAVIARLTDNAEATPPWQDVRKIAGLSTLSASQSGLRPLTLFVFHQQENASPDVRGSGPYLQTMTETLGVVIVAKVINDDQFDFTPIRKTLRERLFGWTPDPEHEPLWLGNGRLLNVQRGMATWLDNFTTEYTEDQNRYGS